MIKLKVKEEYWVLTDLSHSRIIDESNFNDLQLISLIKTLEFNKKSEKSVFDANHFINKNTNVGRNFL